MSGTYLERAAPTCPLDSEWTSSVAGWDAQCLPTVHGAIASQNGLQCSVEGRKTVDWLETAVGTEYRSSALMEVDIDRRVDCPTARMVPALPMNAIGSRS